MTYSQIRSFHAVARERSFSKAATLLRVTQPAVTLQVQALEKAYGVSLIQRGKGVLALTSLGQAMFEATRRFFAEEERVYELISKSSALEIGTVRLGADGPHVALDIVSSFRARYPRVELQVVLGNGNVIWEDILSQHVDAAILANPQPDRRVSSRGFLWEITRGGPINISLPEYRKPSMGWKNWVLIYRSRNCCP